MSSDAFYDRTTGNISGVTPLTFLSVLSPAYGSRVSFSSSMNMYETQNGYFNSIPLSVNSLNAKFELRYDTNELQAQQLVSFLERKEGHILFPFSDPSNFYKTVSGVCDNYAVNHMNKRHYEVAMSFEVNQAPTLLNWSGMTFINAPAIPWSTSQQYKKYDIAYFPTNTNKLNNFYYCIEDHQSSSSSVDGPTGSNTKWTQQFFFEPDVGLQKEVNLNVNKVEFKNSFVQRMKTRKNLSVINLNYKFENIDTRKAKAIMHFLENKAGYRKFYNKPVSVYNRLKVFYVPTWSHTWNYFDSHTIEVNLIEDPLGVIPIDS